MPGGDDHQLVLPAQPPQAVQSPCMWEIRLRSSVTQDGHRAGQRAVRGAGLAVMQWPQQLAKIRPRARQLRPSHIHKTARKVSGGLIRQSSGHASNHTGAECTCNQRGSCNRPEAQALLAKQQGGLTWHRLDPICELPGNEEGVHYLIRLVLAAPPRLQHPRAVMPLSQISQGTVCDELSICLGARIKCTYMGVVQLQASLNSDSQGLGLDTSGRQTWAKL